MDSDLPMPFSVSGDYIVGARPDQEDAFGIEPTTGDQAKSGSGFIVLADGVGGEADGQFASRAAVAAALEALRNGSRSMLEVAHTANLHLADAKRNGDMHPDACTTLIALAYGGGLISWASVGDSLLLIRDTAGKVGILNKRHIQGEYLQEQLELERISQAEFDRVPENERNAIYSCISGDPLEFVDVGEHLLKPGERIILASDGILYLGDARLAPLLAELRDASAEETVRTLLASVSDLHHPQQDNTTVVVLDYKPGAAQTPQENAPQEAAGSQPTAIYTPLPDASRILAAATRKGDSPRQEDSLWCVSNAHATLAAVADGAGGHRGGDLASKAAMDCVRELWESTLREGLPTEQAHPLLESFLRKADEAVRKHAIAPGTGVSGRSTLALIYLHGTSACVAHVGDTRVYMQHTGGKWEQLTRDDSVLQLDIKMGDVTPEEAWQHEDQSLLTQALGSGKDQSINPHVRTIDRVSPSDTFLVCCDGFWNQLRPEKWQCIPLERVEDLKSLADQWCDRAVADSQPKPSDNVSLIIIGPGTGRGAHRPKPASTTRRTAVYIAGLALALLAAILLVLWLAARTNGHGAAPAPEGAPATSRQVEPPAPQPPTQPDKLRGILSSPHGQPPQGDTAGGLGDVLE